MVEKGIVTSGNPGEAMDLTRPYWRECTAHYFGQIQLIDDQLGELMRALVESGLDRDTLVIFSADHGEALGDHGLWGKGPYHYDGVIRVPFVARWPGRISPGTQIPTPCSLLDLAPTLVEIAGAKVPGDCPVQPPEAPAAPPAWPGRSLVPLLFNQQSVEERAVLVEMDEDYLGFKLRTLVTRRHRLTVYSGKPYGELFDLEDDPAEFQNLWARPEHRALRDHLSLQLLDLIIRQDISVPRQVARA
jgi:arylsulfatase A-like enzyme